MRTPLLVTCTALLVCCSPSLRINDSLVRRLNNRGPVALSSDNPYLAANLLVSREASKSSEVKGFLQHRGAPSAVEVSKDNFGPLFMNFFYPENRQYFSFEELEDSWLITGPFKIEADKMKQVALLTREIEGEPKLIEDASSAAPQIPAPSPAAGDEAALIKSSGPQPFVPDEASDIESIIKQSPQIQAEITPKGDLVHYVSFSGETLSILARWYTKDLDNAGKIARINRLGKPDALSIGDTIVIPSYLLQNKNRLTEEALGKLQRLAAKERR